ncbi:MAG: hypothetical protein JWO59_1580 [Chloroflexi bacterium]|nr:hypothetical protein [Chloroflexota bacterium]
MSWRVAGPTPAALWLVWRVAVRDVSGMERWALSTVSSAKCRVVQHCLKSMGGTAHPTAALFTRQARHLSRQPQVGYSLLRLFHLT